MTDDMGDIEALLTRPRMFRVLYALAKKEPMNMREFTHFSKQSQQYAKELRDEMEELGLLAIKELSGHGNAGILEIRLSSLGSKVADHLLGIDDALKGQRAKK